MLIPEKPRLETISLTGYRSIKSAEIKLDRINVLIGANGAGKSNLVSFFKMLNYLTTQALQRFIAESGFANSLLHYGTKTTQQLETTLSFQTAAGTNKYHARLFHAAVDTLAFADEAVEYAKPGETRPMHVQLGSGHKESLLKERGERGDKAAKTAKTMSVLLGLCRVFQFHDTSATAYIRQNSEIDKNRYLLHDAGNLAAFLYRLRQTEPFYYNRIVGTIRQFAPFFGDFVLEPDPLNPRFLSLRWTERDSDHEFGPHHLSDGTLRAMALVSLLLQPEDELPAVIVVDEPELGLHPTAIALICDVVRQASFVSQIVLATQSTFMLDQFEPEEVIVVERRAGCSEFARLNREELEDWREEYSLGELWEKNVLGGKPT